MNSLAKFRRLTWTERGLLLRATFLLGLILAGLKLLSFGTLRRLLDQGREQPSGPPPADAFSPERVVWAVRAAGRRMPGGLLCLPQALAVKSLLERLGYRPVLHIGVAAPAPGDLRAHAWVEHEGHILVGAPGAEAYTPLAHL